jgi:hypothetical protein
VELQSNGFPMTIKAAHPHVLVKVVLVPAQVGIQFIMEKITVLVI